MKSTVKVEKNGYPKLMVSLNGHVYLMFKRNCGTRIHCAVEGSLAGIGEYSTTLSCSEFTDFTGTVTLSNN